MGISLALSCAMGLVMLHGTGDTESWDDTFYQYRVPVTVEAEGPGLQRVDLPPEAIPGSTGTTASVSPRCCWIRFSPDSTSVNPASTGLPSAVTTLTWLYANQRGSYFSCSPMFTAETD